MPFFPSAFFTGQTDKDWFGQNQYLPFKFDKCVCYVKMEIYLNQNIYDEMSHVYCLMTVLMLTLLRERIFPNRVQWKYIWKCGEICLHAFFKLYFAVWEILVHFMFENVFPWVWFSSVNFRIYSNTCENIFKSFWKCQM